MNSPSAATASVCFQKMCRPDKSFPPQRILQKRRTQYGLFRMHRGLANNLYARGTTPMVQIAASILGNLSVHSNVLTKVFEYYLVNYAALRLPHVISLCMSSLHEFASLSSTVSGRPHREFSTPSASTRPNPRFVTPAETYAYKRLRLQVPHNHMLAGYRGGWGRGH